MNLLSACPNNFARLVYFYIRRAISLRKVVSSLPSNEETIRDRRKKEYDDAKDKGITGSDLAKYKTEWDNAQTALDNAQKGQAKGFWA